MGRGGDVRAEGAGSVAVGGDVREGAVIVTGDHNVVVQVDGENALLLERLAVQRLPVRELRPPPLDHRPPRSPRHIGRVAEAGALAAAITAGDPVELHGVAEIGKTFVLADVLSRHDPALLPDGVVYLFAKGKALRDLLQELLETFYDCRPRYVAGEPELRDALRDRRALLVLDSVELGRDELQQLVMAAPGCRFVLASRERALWEGAAVEVAGLPLPDALAVLEQELGRPLAEAERSAAARLCESLGGHPLKLRQAAAQVRAGSASLEDLAGGEAQPALRAAMVEALTPQDREVVRLLAALGGATVGVERLAELLGDPAVGARLEALEQRGYVASGSPRYRAVGVLTDAGLDPGVGSAAAVHFAGWLATRPPAEAVVAETQALRALLRVAEPNAAIKLARGAADAFAGSRRWGTWGDLLEAALAAGRTVDDGHAVAWALHQLGTRAFCLGDAGGGVRMLQTALAMREDLGDAAGAAASRHNLEFIRGGGPGGDGEQPGPEEDGPGGGRRLAVAAGVALMIAGGVAAATLAGGEEDRVRPATETETEAEPADPPVTVTTEPLRDRVPPVITIRIPEASAAKVRVVYACVDDFGPEGIRCEGEVHPAGDPAAARSARSGELLTDLPPGRYEFTVTAVDRARNRAEKKVTFPVDDDQYEPPPTVTPDSVPAPG